MKITGVISSLLLFICCQSAAQEVNKIIQKGNDLYKQNQFDKAEAAYKEASDAEKGNTTAAFNRASAQIRQDKKAEASSLLDEVIMNTNDPVLKSKSYYNQGVMLSGLKKLEESIEAYKNSLRQNPDDKEARENLQKALLELKKRTPPPPKKENKKQQQKQKPQQQKMNEKEAEQRMDLLDQKEKELQQRMQKAKTGVAQPKDW